MKYKEILMTFDVELFFEKPGTYKNCIEIPVKKLLSVLRKNDVKAIFFVDMLYYFKLSDYPELRSDKESFLSLMNEIVCDGHEIGVHIHPHWLSSVYNNDEWKIDKYKYRVDQLSKKEIEENFEKCCDFVKDLYSDKNKKIIYRAGGWCIQPFSNLVEVFIKNNICYDSSSAFGLCNDTLTHKFDFRNFPRKIVYRFDDIGYENSNGKFIEIAITSFKKNIFEKIISYILRNKDDKFGDGNVIDLNQTSVFKLVFPSYDMLAFEENSKIMISHYLKKSKDKLAIFISHPKNFNDYTLECIEFVIEHYKILNLESVVNKV